MLATSIKKPANVIILETICVDDSLITKKIQKRKQKNLPTVFFSIKTLKDEIKYVKAQKFNTT